MNEQDWREWQNLANQNLAVARTNLAEAVALRGDRDEWRDRYADAIRSRDELWGGTGRPSIQVRTRI